LRAVSVTDTILRAKAFRCSHVQCNHTFAAPWPPLPPKPDAREHKGAVVEVSNKRSKPGVSQFPRIGTEVTHLIFEHLLLGDIRATNRVCKSFQVAALLASHLYGCSPQAIISRFRMVDRRQLICYHRFTSSFTRVGSQFYRKTAFDAAILGFGILKAEKVHEVIPSRRPTYGERKVVANPKKIYTFTGSLLVSILTV